MLRFEIPGRETIEVSHLVLDYNGTVATDGKLIPGIKERIDALKENLEIHILTADTYGTVRKECEPLGVSVESFPREGAAECKLEIVKNLSGGVVTVGNGFNDILMSDEADLSVAVVGDEGMCSKLILHTDVLVNSILDALDLFIKPGRLKATLRS
ncbi:MAG: ATPase P [Clostridia bacterium]|nr:ATPase P [Clostridia bacterium]